MVVYKFGGALARSKRGLEALARLVREMHTREQLRARRTVRKSVDRGLVVVVSAIGHTTRYLGHAAELAEDGKLIEAEASLDRTLSQHEILAASLQLDSEKRLFEEFDAIVTRARSLIEGIAITRELSPRTRDAVLALGESFAIALVRALLLSRDVPVHVVDAKQVIITNESFGHATPDLHAITQHVEQFIRPRLKRGNVVLLHGFIGATPDGITTTMGSESSDLTATLLAAALRAEEVVIWKQLPGIYSADPELVPKAKLIRALSFEEAEEIGRRGARVLFQSFAHPLIATSPKTLLRIATPFGTSSRHTLLSRNAPNLTRHQKPLGVALEEHLASIILTRREDVERTSHHSKHDAAEQLFADAMIAWKTATETALIVDADMKRPLQRRLNRERYTIKEGLPLTAISVIVRKMKTESFNPLLISAVTRSLRQFQVYALLPIEQSIVILVDEREGKAALKKLHHDLFET